MADPSGPGATDTVVKGILSLLFRWEKVGRRMERPLFLSIPVLVLGKWRGKAESSLYCGCL
jgi:hypothetical protein